MAATRGSFVAPPSSNAAVAKHHNGPSFVAPPFSMAAFPKHQNHAQGIICQRYCSLAVSPSNTSISISAFPKRNYNHNHHHLRICPPSKFDDFDSNRNRNYRCRCSSETFIDYGSGSGSVSGSSDSGRGGMMDRLKSTMYQKFKQLIAAIFPPSVPQYYRVINLEMIIVPRNHEDKDHIEDLLATTKENCDAWLHIEEDEGYEIWKLFGDLCRHLMQFLAARNSLAYLLDRCICSRSIDYFCDKKIVAQLPVYLELPSLVDVGNNSEDMIDGFEYQIQVSVDGERSDKHLCTSRNLKRFLQQLQAYKGICYAITANYRSIKLGKVPKINGDRNYSNIVYKNASERK